MDNQFSEELREIVGDEIKIQLAPLVKRIIAMETKFGIRYTTDNKDSQKPDPLDDSFR